jgi:DNA-binding protein YbaB
MTDDELDDTDTDTDDEDDDDEDDDAVEVLAGDDPFAALGLGDLSKAFAGGMPDLGSMVDGLAKVQELQEAEYEGSAGGGLVKIVANGRMDVRSVFIADKALDPPEAELVADLVLAALHDLTTQIANAQRLAMGGMGDFFGV